MLTARRLRALTAGRGRDHEMERSSEARFAFGPDPPTVGIYDPLRNGEAESGAEMSGFAATPVAIEKPRKVFRRDTGSRIGN